jgi:hypothetical protein
VISTSDRQGRAAAVPCLRRDAVRQELSFLGMHRIHRGADLVHHALALAAEDHPQGFLRIPALARGDGCAQLG